MLCFSPLTPYMARMLPQQLLADNRMSSTGIKGLRSVAAPPFLLFLLLLPGTFTFCCLTQASAPSSCPVSQFICLHVYV